MSKYSIKDLWNEFYGKKNEVYDYAGRLMLKSACGNPYSKFQPTIDHIRPIANGGKDVKQNIVLCHYLTNEEKADKFPHWKVNGLHCHANRIKDGQNGYTIKTERSK